MITGVRSLLRLSPFQSLRILYCQNHIDETCAGNEDGEINLTVSGGTPRIPSVGQMVKPPKISPDWVEDFTWPPLQMTMVVFRPPVTIQGGVLLSLTTTVVNSDRNASSASIDLTVTGGWNLFLRLATRQHQHRNLSNLGAGVYTVTVTDDVLGSEDSVTVIVTDFPGPTITGLVTNGSNCVADDASIDATITDGSELLDFVESWSYD